MLNLDVKSYVTRRRIEIGRRIKEERTKQGWSQEQAARAVGCTRVTFTRIEAGQAELTTSELEYLAQAWGVSVQIFH